MGILILQTSACLVHLLFTFCIFCRSPQSAVYWSRGGWLWRPYGLSLCVCEADHWLSRHIAVSN